MKNSRRVKLANSTSTTLVTSVPPRQELKFKADRSFQRMLYRASVAVEKKIKHEASVRTRPSTIHRVLEVIVR
jgi:hypothetical protein